MTADVLLADAELREGRLKIARAMSGRSFGHARPRAPESVYFIQSGNGPIKIGSASAPASRLRSLQVGNPEGLHLLGVEVGGAEREHALHRAFAGDRMRGEWFRPSAALLDYINGLST